MQTQMPFKRIRTTWLPVLAALLCVSMPSWGADNPTLMEKANEEAKLATSALASAVDGTKAAVQDAGQAMAEGMGTLWQRVDESRLKNRTPDEIVAWVIMGVLVGSVAGMMTSLKCDGTGKLGRLLLGLAGAFLGGVVVHIARFDFGWGPVLIRYEELLFSLLGAILLVVVGRVFRARSRKKSSG